MTLDEAIKHCKEKAKINRQFAKMLRKDDDAQMKRCELCAEEHEQLAEWLTELKELREEIALFGSGNKCEKCKYSERLSNEYPCSECCYACENLFTER